MKMGLSAIDNMEAAPIRRDGRWLQNLDLNAVTAVSGHFPLPLHRTRPGADGERMLRADETIAAMPAVTQGAAAVTAQRDGSPDAERMGASALPGFGGNVGARKSPRGE